MAADRPSTGPLAERARAKVNLYLHVTGRRADGYHELDSLVVFADVADRLTFALADDISVHASGPFAAMLPPAGDNLVRRAADGLRAITGETRGAAIGIDKQLPVASGIGGGSADAAAALRGLMRLWQVAPAPEALAELALALGADVPVCLGGRPVFLTGVGETLVPAPPLPRCGLVLANPGVAVSTPEVFRRRDGGYSRPMPFDAAPPDPATLAAWLRDRRNDLAPPAQHLEPVIAETIDALAALPGVLLARMSGSGATCFALFADEPTAADAARSLRHLHTGWWVETGVIESAS